MAEAGLTADLRRAAERVLGRLRESGETLAVAESCTGGLLAAELTAVPGASDVFVGGVIAYEDRIKRELLGVPAEELARLGAVSEVVARRMAVGARTRLGASWGVGITGVAGPTGGTAGKPVGTVWLAVSGPASAVERHGFSGDRDEVRRRSVDAALQLLTRLATADDV